MKKSFNKQPKARKAAKKAVKPTPERHLVENQAAAAHVIGCSIPEVKLAKAMGCRAFLAGNRVDATALGEFMRSGEFREARDKTVGDEDNAQWDKRYKRARALREEHRLEREKGSTWDAEMVKRMMGAGDQAMIDTIRRYLENEMPPLVEGKTAAQILKANMKFLDRMIVELKESRYAAMTKISDEYADEDDDEGE